MCLADAADSDGSDDFFTGAWGNSVAARKAGQQRHCCARRRLTSTRYRPRPHPTAHPVTSATDSPICATASPVSQMALSANRVCQPVGGACLLCPLCYSVPCRPPASDATLHTRPPARPPACPFARPHATCWRAPTHVFSCVRYVPCIAGADAAFYVDASRTERA